MPHARQAFAALLLLALSAASWAQSTTAHAPPVARRVDAVDTAFGLSIPDPYRWMEGEANAEHDAWLDAHGQATRARLDALPRLAFWRERLAAVAGTTSALRPVDLRDDPMLLLRVDKGGPASLLARGKDGIDRMLFDPATEQAAITGATRSPDGRHVAINVMRKGNEIGTIDVLEIASGRRVETVGPVWSEFAPHWLPDGSGFFHTRMRDTKPGDADPLQGMAVYLHRLGQSVAQDQLVVRAGTEDALAIPPNDFPAVTLAPGSNWALLEIVGARASMRACVAPLAEVVTGGTQGWRCVIDDADLVQDIELVGDTLYAVQALDAPNRRLVAIDLASPDANLRSARTVLGESAETVIEGIDAAKDALYVTLMRDGIQELARVDYRTVSMQPIALPLTGTVRLTTSPDADGAWASLGNWLHAGKVYGLRPDGQLAPTPFGISGAPEYPDLLVERVQATSRDGTRVPLTIIRQSAPKADGSAISLIHGYGGYGISVTPRFAPPLLEWARAGHVLAVCHVRGGGERGDGWRLAGQGANKQRGVEDFIACGQAMQDRGWSTRERVFGTGASMGGVLAGGAYTTPGQTAYGGMVIDVGVLNPARLAAAKNGANQFAEVGDPRTDAGMRQLLAMDPYQRLAPGVAYPPLLLTVGLVDQRVAPWNSGKFAAQVMHLSPSTQVWVRTDGGLGHSATSAMEGAAKQADTYAAVEAMAGMAK